MSEEKNGPAWQAGQEIRNGDKVDDYPVQVNSNHCSGGVLDVIEKVEQHPNWLANPSRQAMLFRMFFDRLYSSDGTLVRREACLFANWFKHQTAPVQALFLTLRQELPCGAKGGGHAR